jgi:hypothetical protein
VSVDIELWTREERDLGDGVQHEGDGWLINVSAPEEDDDVPPDLSALADGLRYRIDIGVEGSPDADAWALVRQIMDAIGGAAVDPETGHSRLYPA